MDSTLDNALRSLFGIGSDLYDLAALAKTNSLSDMNTRVTILLMRDRLKDVEAAIASIESQVNRRRSNA